MSNAELTYTGVLVAVLANQLCLPVPSIVFLMAAGALSAHGKMLASMVFFCAVFGCLAGDGCGSGSAASGVLKLCACFAGSLPTREVARRMPAYKFRRYGLWVLCGSKFVPGLDAVMPPLAGAEGVSVAGFLALDLIGSFLWSSCLCGTRLSLLR